MWQLSAATRIYVSQGATDMRKSFNGLYAAVTTILKRDPLTGHLFLFCNVRRNRLKVFYWDGSGFWVCAKRLERGRFSWPDSETLSSQEMTLLLSGIDLKKTCEKKWHRILNKE